MPPPVGRMVMGALKTDDEGNMGLALCPGTFPEGTSVGPFPTLRTFKHTLWDKRTASRCQKDTPSHKGKKREYMSKRIVNLWTYGTTGPGPVPTGHVTPAPTCPSNVKGKRRCRGSRMIGWSRM